MLRKSETAGRLLCTFFAFAAVLPFSALGQAHSQSNNIESISTLIRTGQYSLAVQMANEALQSRARDPRLFTLKAIALSKLGQSSEALAGFQSALNIDANYLPALAGAAELEYKLGSNDAVNYLDRLLKLKPEDQVAHAMRAVVASKAGDCPAAVEHFAKAHAQIDSQAAALQEYGTCLIRLKHLDAASEIFTRLRQIEPGNRQAAYALALIQLTKKEYQGAIETLSPWLSEANGDSKALELASTAYEALGDTPNAVKALRQAIVLNPDRPELYVEFSSISFEHKSYQVGIDMINAGLSRLPQSAKLYVARGVLYAQMGQYEKADQDFTNAALLDPKEAVSSDAQVLAEIQANRLDQALTTVEKRLKEHPTNPFSHYLLAEILIKNGAQPQNPEFSRATVAAEKAVQLKPDFVLARDVLSRLYLESGQTAKAITQCRLALKDDPDDQVALYRLIRALKAEDATRYNTEISQLLHRLAQVREQAKQREVETSQYKLVEASPTASSSKP